MLDGLSLDEYREASSGRPYGALVEFYVVRRDPPELAAEVRSILASLPADGRRAQHRFFNRWNRVGQRSGFWRKSCEQALDEIVLDARLTLARADVPAGERTLLRMFRLATVGLALTAARSPEVRERMGMEASRVRPLSR